MSTKDLCQYTTSSRKVVFEVQVSFLLMDSIFHFKSISVWVPKTAQYCLLTAKLLKG